MSNIKKLGITLAELEDQLKLKQSITKQNQIDAAHAIQEFKIFINNQIDDFALKTNIIFDSEVNHNDNLLNGANSSKARDVH